MNNFIFDESLNNICLILLNIIVLFNLKPALYRPKSLHTNYVILGLFIVFISLYYRPMGGDFWFSLPEFKGQIYMYREHMEPIYVWLKEFVNYDYLLWRFLVWGFAGIFVVAIYKEFKIHPALATICFLTFGLLDSFYYMRNALGFGILYYAVAKYASRVSRFSISNMSVLLIIGGLSYFFHRSMPLYIFLSAIALFLPFRKKTFIYLLISFPFLYGILTIVAAHIMDLGVWQDDGGEYYLEQANTLTTNWKGMISLLIKYMPFIYIIYNFIKYDIDSTDNDAYPRKVFFLIFFLLFYISFLFTGQAASDLAMRFGDTAMFPFSIFIALYFKKYTPNRSCIIFTLLTAFSVFWTFLFVR